MTVSLIVAMSQNRVIGYQNKLPWHLPEDLKRFKEITTGHTVIMGRKTFESIGRPLPGRKNIVLTRNPGYRAEGVVVFSGLTEALGAVPAGEEVFILGGAEVFREALPLADKIHLTLIHKEFQGDTFFPELDLESDFRIIQQSDVLLSRNFELPYQYITAIRRR